jgi:hypothetical protein
VADSLDLRQVLWQSYQSNRRRLKNDSKFIRETLSALLKCAGPTYIVIDGLDETPQTERVVILDEILALLDDSQDVKIFISSRQEMDIEKRLKGIPKTIRLDHRNTGCIQTYVTSHTKKWFSEVDFDPKIQSEIQSLLTPLSSKAQGLSQHHALKHPEKLKGRRDVLIY